MIHALAALLFGAAFTVATAWALGAMVLRRLSAALDRWEARLLAFVVGSACLSAIVFVLCAVHWVKPGVVLAVGVASIGGAVVSGAHRPSGKDFPPLPRLWRWVFVAVMLPCAIFYGLNAMAPEMSPDGMAYHLGVVAQYQRAHGFVPITTNMHASLSEGAEMLFLFAFVFGRHSAAALVHFAFWAALAGLMLCYGRRIGQPAAGVAGAIFTAASPLVAYDGSIAYIDVAVAATLFAMFYLLQVWDSEGELGLLAPIGMLAGFAYAVKYTAGVAIPYAVCLIAWKAWKAGRPAVRAALVVSGFALVFVLPWMAKNWVEVANPLAPFGNRLFPNPYVHISAEEGWRRDLRMYELKSREEIPLQVTVKGDKLAGMLGPLFLLTPLALRALRLREGRQLLLAAAIFGATYFSNIGARFLIPAAPFVSLALALAFAELPWVLLALVGGHVLTSIPPVYKQYAPGSWTLRKVSPKAAVRMIPEETFLGQASLDYNVARMLERLVPDGQRVFAFTPTARSYTRRDVVVGWESAFGNDSQDFLWTALVSDFAPARSLKFKFPEQSVRRVRLIQTASVRDVLWSVSELRVFDGARELQRAAGWRLTAYPNPWEVQLAFDNSPVTRWRSWQDAEPGMYIDVDFGRDETIDSVVVETSNDAQQAKLKVDAMGSDGKWKAVSAGPEESRGKIGVNLRLAAMQELKAWGVRYLLVDDSDYNAQDYYGHARQWGITEIGRWKTRRLYYIQ